MEATTNLNHAKMYWGRGPLPMGAILCGTHGTQALIWLPTGWWEGGAGTLKRMSPDVRRRWLQAIRAEHGWQAPEAIGVSRRTWEGWEQGRTIPADKVLALYGLIQAAQRPS